MNLLALKDWLGDEGKPVPTLHAAERAVICVSGNNGKPCPMNCEPRWWERWIKEPIAQAIKEQLEVKHQMRIGVIVEDELNMCKACGCCLKLKVHTPIQYIKSHLTADQIAKMPTYCWQRKEIEK